MNHSFILLLKLNLIGRFIEDAARPLVTEFKQEHAHKIFEMEITSHFLLFVDKADKDFDAMLKIVSGLFCSRVAFNHNDWRHLDKKQIFLKIHRLCPQH